MPTARPAIGGNWLDSNDTHGMRWDIAGLGKFNTLSFFLIDAADVGAQVLDQGRRHALLDSCSAPAAGPATATSSW